MMAMTVGELNVLLGIDQGPFDRGLRQSEGRFSGFGSKLAGLAKKAAIGTSVALGAGAVAGVKSFADLERGMNEVFTLLPGISEKAMGNMTDQVKDFSVEFGTLPSETVPALYQALSAGVPKGNVFDFMETAQKAATAGVATLETSVSAITGSVNAYGDDISEAGRYSDQMFTAAVATMTKQGEGTAESTTKIRQALVELSDGTSQAGASFEEVAGKSFREFIDGGGNMAGAMQVMEQAAEANGVSVDQLFGSVEAGAAALMLSGDNADLFASNIDAMGDSAGATEAAYKTMDQGIGRSFDKIKAAGAVALADIGESLAPLVASIAGFAETALPAMSAAFEQVRATVEAWWPSIVAAFTTIRDIVGPLIETIVSWISGLGQSSSETGTWLSETWAKVREVFTTAFDAIVAIVSTAVSLLTGFWDRFGTHLIDFARTTWNNIKQVIGGVLDVVIGIFDVFAGVFTGDWSRVWEGIKGIFGGVWEAIKGIVKQAINIVSTVIGAAVAAISQLWSEVWERIKSVVGGAWDWIKRTVSGAVDAFIGFHRNMRDRAVGFFTNLRDRAVAIVGALRDRVAAFFGGLKDRAITAVTTLKGRVIGFFTNIKDRVVGAASSLATEAVAKFVELKDGALEKAGELLDYVTGLPGELVSAIGNVGDLLFDKGSDVVRGLWDGIKSMGTWIKDKVTGFVADVIPGPIAKALGISSPSTVAANLAREVPRGMMVGMDAEASRLMAASERMARAALPDLGVPGVPRVAAAGGGDGASAGAAAGGTVTHIHLESRGDVRDDAHAAKMILSR